MRGRPGPPSAGRCCGRTGRPRGPAPRCHRWLLGVIGGVADQQIGAAGGFFQGRAGGGVPRKDHLDPPPGRPADVAGGHGAAIDRQALPLLQFLPVPNRHAQRAGLVRVEPAGPGQPEAVALAGHPVLGGDGGQGGPALEPEALGGHIHRDDLVGQRPGQQPHDRPEVFQPFGPGQQQRPGAPLAGDGLQQARQAKNVVAVVVGQADSFQPGQAHPRPHGGGLGALAAVEQEAVPLPGQQGRGQGPVGQGHGGGSAQQGDGDHPLSPRRAASPCRRPPRRCSRNTVPARGWSARWPNCCCPPPGTPSRTA